MDLKNISLSGGDSNGLAYFQLWNEIWRNDIEFNVFSASSVGAVMGIPIMSGMVPYKGYCIFKELKGDEYLNYDIKIKNAKWYFKPFMFLKYIFILRNYFYKSCKRQLKYYFPNWKKVLKRCKKVYVSFVKYNDVKKYFGKVFIENLKKHSLVKTLKEYKLNIDNFYDILKQIPVYYISNDGIYKSYGKGLLKISNKIIPPWKAVLCAFNNPLLPSLKIKLDELLPEKVFDGGLIDNYASLCQDNKYDLITCIHKPFKTIKNEFKYINDFVFLLNPSENIFQVKTLKDRGFFEFTDKAIDEEFNQKSSDFFEE